MSTPSRSRRLRVALLAGVIAATFTVNTRVAAQSVRPSDGGRTVSLGQPSRFQSSVGVAAGIPHGAGPQRADGELRIGAYVERLSAVFGLGGAQGELYGGVRNARGTAGARLRVASPFLRLGAGVDFNVVKQDWRGIVSLTPSLRRGGVFGRGTLLRVDALIGRRPELMVGIEAPIRRSTSAGHSRQRQDHVALAAPSLPRRSTSVRPALRSVMDTTREAARNIRWLTIPWLDHTGGGDASSDAAVLARITDLSKRLRAIPGDTMVPAVERETRRFHAALDHAFAVAAEPIADSATGRRLANQARDVLLREVLLPYDRLLGQDKHPDTTHDLARRAREQFVHWLERTANVPLHVVNPALAVFDELLDIVEETRALAHAEWGSGRHVWLPLQYALLPEAHDSQEELDALIARATDAPFHDGNAVSYVINEQFQWQLSRTIRAARDYHVLHIHDFRGLDDNGELDEMSFSHVLRSYYAAMIERVRAYDSTGTFPTYIILLDQYFYEARSSRLWMDLLENPLNWHASLPPRFAAWQDSLAAAQRELRAAVARSARLSAQRTQFGDAWLRNLVKVHVNITNIHSPTFSSWRLVKGFPMPDNMARDHRKIAFYDVTEADSLRGEALLTGAGVGEHYAGLEWEDRSVLVRGPVNLELKRSARELLLQQGLRADQIPAALQPVTRVPVRGVGTRVDLAAGANSARAALLVNETGFADKDITVARAVLYTLLPAGSVVAIPGPLWNSAFLGAALVGSAWRGLRVLVITPSLMNSQSRSFGSQVLSRELFWRLLTASQMMDGDIARHGGLLKVGVFAQDVPVTDIPAKMLGVRRTLREHPWLRDLLEFPPAVYAGLDSLAAQYQTTPRPDIDSSDGHARSHPNLHIKAHFVASREAWRVLARPEWVAYTREYMMRRMTQVTARGEAISSFGAQQEPLIEVGSADVGRWYDGLPPAERERVIFYTLLGSTNQNARGFSTDGEVTIALSHWPAVIPMLDLLSMIGQSRWIETRAELDVLLPPRSALVTRLSHWFKAVF